MKNRYKILFLLGTIFLSLQLSAQKSNSFFVQTKTENGIIEGLYDTKTNLQMYLGVPFAKPPIGELRWKAPQPLDNWDGVKETKVFGPRPVQEILWGDMNSRSNGVSEDCLYLNIWTPAKRNIKNLPVLVYFFGGGFVAGDGSEYRYDGTNMAQKGIVVVTVNYRLNIFGFFAHPELSAETPYKSSGNYGFLDQNAALKWVQKNITAFGGDTGKVTIAGESAGAASVNIQMTTPLSKGLMRAAIAESGAAIRPTFEPLSLTEAERRGVEFAKKAGCTSIEQLRKLSTRDMYELYKEYKQIGFPSVWDGYVLPKSMNDIFKAKEQAQIPLLIGWNSAEISGNGFMPYTEENFIKKVKEEYPNDYEDILKTYPHTSEKEIELSATALASDRFIVYDTWKWFDLHRKNSTQSVYRYLFSKIRPPLTDQSFTPGLAGGKIKKDKNDTKETKQIGASHASEIEFCMGNLNLIKDYVWTEDDYKVSETMMNYFANFIKTGNPNHTGLPEWLKAEPNDSTPPVMIIDVNSKVEKANDSRFILLDKIFKNK